MRSRVFALAFATLMMIPSVAEAGPPSSSSKERVEPAQSNMTRDQALTKLVQAEGLLLTDQAADALLTMLECYLVLEATDGAEAAGVKELRSWLVKALETIGLPDEAATLRARGSYIDHSLEIMPSTWFKASGSVTSTATMSNDQALAAVERGLGLLEQGSVDGLALLIDAYFAIEQHQGPESDDARVLRSFLVGLLETGGFVDEAKSLRQRGSVAEATQEDLQIYTVTWERIIQASQSGSSSSILGGIDKSSIKSSVGGSTISGSSSSGSSSSGSYSGDSSSSHSSGSSDDHVEYQPERPKVLQPGSAVPSVGLDLGLGSFVPSVGSKGLIWTFGIDVHWTLFHAKFFSMQLGGAGQFGRNRDKRWLTDASGGIGLMFDFEKVYFAPEFSGGYDGVAGGDKPIAEALRWAPAGYYQFGGRLGVRFAERFGLYGRAMRVNRIHDVFAHETRVRGGFLLRFDKATLDLAFVFTDFESKGDGNPSARMFGGIIGFRI